MKKVSALLSAVVLTGGLTTAALAADNPHPGTPGSTAEHTMSPAPLMGEADSLGTISKIDASAGKVEVKTPRGTAEVYGEPELLKTLKEGEQVRLEVEPLSGTISKIDRSTGMLEVKTAKGTSKLYFAPEAMKNLKEGEQVAVDLERAPQESHREAHR